MNITEKIERLRSQRLDELSALKARGGKIIGYLCNYAPVELIKAAGAVPVRLLRGGHQASIAAERFLRTDACPFCRACLGNFESDPLYQLVDAVVAVNTCDMMRRLPEVIERYFKIPIFQVYLPRTSEPLPHRLVEFQRQLVRLSGELERFSGRAGRHFEITTAITEFNRLRQVLRELDKSRELDRPVITESELLDISALAGLAEPSDLCDFLTSNFQSAECPSSGTRDNFEQSNPANQRPSGSRPRLLLAGSIVTDDDRWLIRLIEERAAVVADAFCSGARWFGEELTVDADSWASVAGYYFNRIPCPCRRPNERLYEHLTQLVSQRRVQGVIYKTLLYCDSWAFEAVRLQQRLKIPFLHLANDYSPESREQVRTRVEAFLETL